MNNEIKANEGMIFTNGEAYGKTVYLGCNDSADNWYEITEAEYEEIQEKLRKEAELSDIPE